LFFPRENSIPHHFAHCRSRGRDRGNDERGGPDRARAFTAAVLKREAAGKFRGQKKHGVGSTRVRSDVAVVSGMKSKRSSIVKRAVLESPEGRPLELPLTPL